MNAYTKDRIATGMFWTSALLVLIVLGILIGYIFYHGLRAIDWQFITSPPQSISAGGGIAPQIFNSFYILFLTMLISVPVGLLAGIYLAEYAGHSRLAEIIRIAIETLTSLPSIVIGLFGLLVFVNATGWGYSLMSGALALTIINLPFLVRVSEESIRGVSRELVEGSLALGATHWQTVWKIIVPCAFSGLVTGIIITSGRVFGEAAALLYTAGMSSPVLDFTNWNIFSQTSPLNPFRPAETLAVHIWKVNSEGLIPDVRRVADGSAAILIIVILAFNFGVRGLVRIFQKRMTAT